MGHELQKIICLQDELQTAQKLIHAGFGALQEIDMDNSFYHLPQLLLASGLERFLKVYIALVYEDRNDHLPRAYYFKHLGHNLSKMKDIICNEFYGGTRRQIVADDLQFMKNDEILSECLRILSSFGAFARYYNLDLISGKDGELIDPEQDWKDLERSVEDPTPYLGDLDSLHRDYYPRVNSALIGKLERFIRAITLQFTIGDHADSRGRLRQMSGQLTEFRTLRDDQFGTVDYRESVKAHRERMDTWKKFDDKEILEGKWPARIVTRAEIDGEWPFRADRIIIECRDGLFSVAYIEGYAFALNGSAHSRFQYPFPHEFGEAILGRSIHAFTEMARELAE